MKHVYVLIFATLLTACGKSLTYQEVESLKSKCEGIGGTAEYKRYGTLPEGTISDVDCKVGDILFRHGKY